MDLGRIKDYLERIDDEDLSIGELAEIDEAFRALVASGVELRDDPDNALAKDQLEELEEHAPLIEKEIYRWVVQNFGESEARDPSWSTRSLADHLNQMPVIFGAEDSKLGFLLGELDG
jgi:hypothetical protein